MSLRRTRAVFVKEFRHIVRDARSLGLALAIPLLMLLLFGFALSLDVDRIPTLIYDAGGSPESRDLAAHFQGSRFFDVQGWTSSYAEIERGIDESRILLGVAIPRDYSRNIQAGRTADVQILIDGSDSNTASIALGYTEAVMRGYSFQLRSSVQNRRGGQNLALPVDARLRVWYNPTLESRNYVVPGLIAVILMLIAALLTSLTIAREWDMGSMEQLLSTPLRPAEIVLGKMLAYFVLGVVDAIVAVLVGMLVFHVPLRGSILDLAITGSVFLCGALFWGVFVSAATRTQVLAYQVGLVTSFLPGFLLSGFVYSIENMPPPIQVITYVFPARYFVTILKGIYLKGVGFSVLWPEAAFLLLYASVVFLLAVRKMRSKLA